MGQNTTSSYPPMKGDNDLLVTDNQSKCELFNNFFASHSSIDELQARIPDFDDNSYNIINNVRIAS